MSIAPARSFRRRGIAALGLIAVCLSFAWAQPADVHAPLTGKLLIIGGGVTARNGPTIYRTMGEQMPDGATIGILGTASGDPAAAARSATSQFTRHAADHPTRVIDVRPGEANRAQDAANAQAIDACGGLFFTGGAQDRIIESIRPDGTSTGLYAAVQRVLERGGIVAGSSAGAAIMSDPMIYNGTSAAAFNGTATTRPGVPMGPGLGLFPFGLVDQHFLQRGRFGRLVVALEQSEKNFGFGISEDRAILVDRGTGHLITIGQDAVVFIDRRAAQRARSEDGSVDSRLGLRVSLVGSGDVIEGVSGKLHLNPARRQRDRVVRSGSPAPLPNAWARLALRGLMHDLISGTHASAVALDRGYELHFIVDDQTQAFAMADDPTDVAILGLRLDIVRRAHPDTQPTTEPTEVD